MNKLLQGLLAGAVLAIAAQAATAQTVLRLDEVAVGELDPARASDYADSILMFNVYDTLVLPRQGGPGHVPHLAESWEGSGTEFTFKLRENVNFHSGNPMTADDVVYSFERMTAIGQGLSFLFGNVESVEAVDTHTVRFNLSEPYAPFVSSLVRLPIIDSVLIQEMVDTGDDMGSSYLSSRSAGTGAYWVESHNPQEETVMMKFDGYFLGVSEKAPDTVRLRYGLEAPTVRTLIAQGEHDISSQWLPPEVKRALAADGNQLLTEGGTGSFYFKMNTAKAPLDDVHCRLAVSNAFDYASVLKLIAINDDISEGTPATGAITAGMFGAKPADHVLSRDIDAAKAHLAQCSHDPSEFSIEISWIAEVPLEERLALLLQANLSEVGINSTIKKIPWAAFAGMVGNPETTPDISQIFVTAVTGDPDTLLYGMYHSTKAGTWQSPEHLNDAEVDQLLDAGRVGATDAEREAAYSALNDRLLAIAPSIYGFDSQAVFVARPGISVPALSDPDKAFGLDTMGFAFRLMEME